MKIFVFRSRFHCHHCQTRKHTGTQYFVIRTIFSYSRDITSHGTRYKLCRPRTRSKFPAVLLVTAALDRITAFYSILGYSLGTNLGYLLHFHSVCAVGCSSYQSCIHASHNVASSNIYKMEEKRQLHYCNHHCNFLLSNKPVLKPSLLSVSR